MSVYNGGKYLREAIESILAQTFTDFEFIIINDGSTDGSGDILDEYAQRDERVIAVHQENTGLIGALNAGLGRARGELVARMDADDIALPNRLREQVAYMQENPEVGLLGGQVVYVDEDGKPNGNFWNVPTSPGYVGWRLLFRTVLAHPASMYRRSCVEEVGNYDPRALHNEDYNLWTRLFWRTRIDNLTQPVLLLRRLPDGITNTHYATQQESAVWSMCELHEKLLGDSVDPFIVERLRVVAHKGHEEEGADEAASLASEVSDYVVRLHRSYVRWASPTLQERLQINKHLSAILRALSLDAGSRFPREARAIRRQAQSLRALRIPMRLGLAMQTRLLPFAG